MKYAYFAIVLLIGELLGLLIFSLLKNHYLGKDKNSPHRKGAALKGLLERTTICLGLLHGFPHIITAFAALKLGTRLHEEKENSISNAYFLVGNLLSLLLAIVYVVVTRDFLWQ
ncbi:MAG: hypothetical protein QNJ97_10195 [Myxococcota bacterium]|nr:hypothetical protein [Myxococcota bacterium]